LSTEIKKIRSVVEPIRPPQRIEAYISANAFWGFLISAIEVYKKETYGLLIGYRNQNMFIIEHAVQHQTASRTHLSVRKNTRAEKRMEGFLKNMPHLSLIGDFHSHTGWGELKGVSSPSRTDVGDMKPNAIYIILEVNDKKRSQAWGYTTDGSLAGTVDDYHFRIDAYYLSGPQQNRVKRANIFCPYAIGFNAKMKPVLALG
jgi:proteasome lid subunit RPN8/RPN11